MMSTQTPIETVKNNLINVLDTFCPDNVFLQGTLNPDEQYPDKFITFFITTSELGAYYNNNPNRADFYINVMFYSNNPTEVATVPNEIISALFENGFIPENYGYDIYSGKKSHTGWAMELVYPYYAPTN